MRTKQRDRALLATIASFHMQRFPGTFFLVFTHTEGVLRRVAHGRFSNFVRLGAADVENTQTEGASNSGVSAEAVPQGIVPAIHADLLSNRTIDNRHRRCREGGDVDAM